MSNMDLELNGQLDIILGTMFSGKTTYLLSKIAKLAELNYSILYINIEFDNRSENMFSTHNPFFDNHTNFIKKNSIKNNVHMIKLKKLCANESINLNEYDVIIVDESHFFDDLIEFVGKCLENKKYIIVSGLIADFKGKKFGKTLDLIPLCTNIKRLHAYCSECAKNKKISIAIYSKKITKSKKSIDIGGADKYIPVCRFHYNLEEHNQMNCLKHINQVGQIEQIEQIELVQSIKPKTNDFIELEINFVNYPMIPPILKLSNTSIKNFPLKLVKNCNGVNEKKQIELDILNPTQWKFTYNLLRVIEDLKKCVEDTC